MKMPKMYEIQLIFIFNFCSNFEFPAFLFTHNYPAKILNDGLLMREVSFVMSKQHSFLNRKKAGTYPLKEKHV